MNYLIQFPEPYPDETLYSVFCRYHERSCNRTASYTMGELFGRKVSLQSTLLSPNILQFCEHWIEKSASINLDTIRNNHTAINYAMPLDLCDVDHLVYSTGEEETTYYFSQKAFHHSQKLRYCPKCVHAQEQLFGEAYWQILPQIVGAEVCPIHEELYRDSEVPVRSIRYRFISASAALNNNTVRHDIPQNAKQVEAWHDLYLVVAHESRWLLRNGKNMESYTSKRAQKHISRTIDTKDTELLQERARECGALMNLQMGSEEFAYYMSIFLSAPQVIYLLHCLYGSMRAFCDDMSSNPKS